MFRVPESSPPSTPEQQRQSLNKFAVSNPTTTPLGPPPTSFTNASTTPAGPPPSSIFGSGHFGSASPFPQRPTSSRNQFNSSPPGPRHDGNAAESDDDGDAMEEDAPVASVHESQIESLGAQRLSELTQIAKSFVGKAKQLDEPDHLIVATEQTCQGVYQSVSSSPDNHNRIKTDLSLGSEALLKEWTGQRGQIAAEGGIGPADSAPGVAKASFLACLALGLHQPPPKAHNKGRLEDLGRHLQSIPEVMLNWLRTFHDPYPEDYREVMDTPSNVCAHPRFWDVILSLQVRGKMGEILQLLRHADFRYAETAVQEGADHLGYQGTQLSITNQIVTRTIRLLEQCPAIRNQDWNVTGADWSVFRSHVIQELSYLEVLSQGFANAEVEEEPFEAENFGMSSIRSDELSMSQMSRRAGSKVPWKIYQNLQYLYGQLLGTHSEIIAASSDWVEATIGITAWWDGEQNDAGHENLAASRSSFRQSRQRDSRRVDTNPISAYLDKLSSTFKQIEVESDEVELRVNTSKAAEVGLACIFGNDIESVVGIIQNWSAAICTGVVEMASLGGWLNASITPSKAIMDRFDQSDLMVLSFAQKPDKGINKDEVLSYFAELLITKGSLMDDRPGHHPREYEGWELAIQVIGRLNDDFVADSKLNQLLDKIKLTTPERVQKVVDLCIQIGLVEQSRKTAEKFADYLSENSNNYGDALLYYARARQSQRVKDVLNVLVSSCLAKSIAYPPVEDLDSTLKDMISAPRRTLARFRGLDRQAAELLSSNLSGYAMVRRFYELRDSGVELEQEQKPAAAPVTRLKEAASVLTGLITSAADSIHGGLYDPSVESVIPVDCLLVLLGEALMFIDQPKLVFSTQQTVAIMKAVEDLSTAPSGVFSRSEECFKSTLANAQGAEAPSPPANLKKSVSSMTTSSQFSMIDSRISGSNSHDSSESSGVLVSREAKRGWDWRKGLNKGTTSADVLKILRLGLAREMARHWME